MTLEELLVALGYAGSPTYLRRGDSQFESQPSYGHIFRRARDRRSKKQPRWQLEGVYGVQGGDSIVNHFVPVIYVCTADDEPSARDLHGRVWNQDIVPFVLVHTPQGLRFYSGFNYSVAHPSDTNSGPLNALTEFITVQEVIRLFHAREVDEGRLWQHPEHNVNSTGRLHRQLLSDLRKLDSWLCKKQGLLKDVSHALIGKFVYLRYLRDRGILSDERLALWEIREEDVFGRNVKKSSLEKLTIKLEDWLNGEVFPFPWSGPGAPKAEHIKRVAAAFLGDRSAQLHLSFEAYDFSYIPIETISLIYEQFLHADDDEAVADADDEDAAALLQTKGRTQGAYYTPLPLVNFMLAQMESRRPLEKGMKVFDPSCGSGAFLVQAYRRIIEKTYPVNKPRPKPSDLRDLLRSSIFGCDVDGDACEVTKLSLVLTLLDYVEPPDLLKYPSFQLPSLGNDKKDGKKNIFKGNFFGMESQLGAVLTSQRSDTFDWQQDGFDWIVGNPPWKSVNPKSLSDTDEPVWEWMRDKNNIAHRPIGSHQVAQAFAWEAPRYLAERGECGLLVPGMGLFEDHSQQFRKSFFAAHELHTVANFANLAEVLFDGRSRVPAAAIFFQKRSDEELLHTDEAITVYSPLIVNQEATRPLAEGTRGKLWSLVINASEVRTLELGEVLGGSGLPWKLAMWGSAWDERLINRLERKWDSFEELEERGLLLIGEGPQLRERPTRASTAKEDVGKDLEKLTKEDLDKRKFERIDSLAGRLMLKTTALSRFRNIFSVPAWATKKNKKRYVCLVHGKAGLTISEPPHILLSAARNFAIYSNERLIVESRQLGIISPSKDEDFLKALSLFLSSDFAFYHQFIRSTELGIKRDRATLAALRKMPIPLAQLSRGDLLEWVALHAKLAKCAPRSLEDLEQGRGVGQRNLFEFLSTGDLTHGDVDKLLNELNEMTAKVLGLSERERILIHDLVRVRYSLNDGKQGYAAMRRPTERELYAYSMRLKRELDAFVGSYADRRHRITAIVGGSSAMVEIDFTEDHSAAQEPQVVTASTAEAAALARTRSELLKERAQWVYFNRNLRLYRGRKAYIFKPFNRFHWVESAAMVDAGQIVAETLAGASE